MQEQRNFESTQSNTNMELKRVGELETSKEEKMDDQKNEELDPGSTLQMFLDQIPVSSIPGIRSSPVVELKTGDSVRDAIRLLYEKNVLGALIYDVSDNDNTAMRKFSDRYVGFVSCANMVLWCLEKCDKFIDGAEASSLEEADNNAFFAMLEQNHCIGQTKIMELATSFLWDPFLPVNLDDTLFHVLLLLSNHQLQVVPIIQRSESRVIGFVTQNALINLLLQSSGLEWFDNIADKTLSDFRLDNGNDSVLAYEDESISEALHSLMENRANAVVVVNPATKRLTGGICGSDLYTLLKNDYLLKKWRNLTVKDIIQMEKRKPNPRQPTDDQGLKAVLSTSSLLQEDNFYSRMDSPVTNKKSDSLKQAMKKLADSGCNISFLVDDYGQAAGLLTPRDIIIQFAPPCIDSNIQGGGFFESALQQTGYQIQNGKLVCNRTR